MLSECPGQPCRAVPIRTVTRMKFGEVLGYTGIGQRDRDADHPDEPVSQ